VNKGLVLQGGRITCGHAKPDGTLCGSEPSPGTHRCKVHGGSARIGVAHPNTKTGRFSNFLPKQYREGFFAALEDAEGTSLRHELALLDARQEELLQRLPSGEHGAAWRDVGIAQSLIQDAIICFRDKRPSDGFVNVQEALAKLQAAADVGAASEKIWDQLHATMEQKRKIVDAEIKRESRLSEVITGEQLAWFMSQVALLFRKYITDPRLLRDAVADLRVLTGGKQMHEPYAPPNVPALLAGDDDYGED
jgi:hypothetical protein